MNHPRPRTTDWLCPDPDCGRPWPCTGARERLVAEYSPRDRIALALYLAELWLEASTHLSEPAGILYGRFIGWNRGRL